MKCTEIGNHITKDQEGMKQNSAERLDLALCSHLLCLNSAKARAYSISVAMAWAQWFGDRISRK